MKKILFIITVLFAISVSAQSDYEVVIIPKKYSFLNDENKFNLNSLTKSFFETEGFIVYYAEDYLSKEIATNRCNAMFVDVLENNSVFVRKLEVVLMDCQNNILLKSIQGNSREKDFNKSYNEALRMALTSMRGSLSIKKPKTNKGIQIIEKTDKEVTFSIEQKSLKTQVEINKKGELYALPISNGYKIVNSAPAVIYLIYATSNESVFIASKGEINGVFMKKMNGWFFEYYKNEALVSEKVEVKF
jgi:hypothetical protein